MSRRANVGMTNLNPYKTEYTYATEESRRKNAWESWCYYRSEGGKCSNKKSSNFNYKCKQKHSCMDWTLEKKYGAEKDETVDERISFKDGDCFGQILNTYFHDSEKLKNVTFRDRLKEAVFGENVQTEDNVLFDAQLDALCCIPLNQMPFIRCLCIEEDTKRVFQKIDGSYLAYSWNTEAYMQTNRILRLLAYFCLGGNRSILEKWKSDWNINLSFAGLGRTQNYKIEEYAERIKDCFDRMDRSYGWDENTFRNRNDSDKAVNRISDNQYAYVYDMALVSDASFHSEQGKKCRVYCAYVIPIVNTYETPEDVKYNLTKIRQEKANYHDEWEIQKVVKNRCFRNQLMGIGKITDYTMLGTVKAEFLDFPFQIFEYKYPESFETGDNTFVETSEYEKQQHEIEKYYRKKLMGKKVRYKDLEFPDERKIYELVLYEGTITDYRNGMIEVIASPIDGRQSSWNFPRHFNYPIRQGCNYAHLEIL